MFLFVNQCRTTFKSSSSWSNFTPLCQAIIKPCLTATNSVILFVVRPTRVEKPVIHRPWWSRRTPPALANPRLSKALPSVLSLQKGYRGACHLTSWGTQTEVRLVVPARKWNSVAAWTEEKTRLCWDRDWVLKILSLRANQSFQHVKGK